MIESNQFWKSWTVSYRRIFLVLAILFMLVVAGSLIVFIAHPWPVFSWQQLQDLQIQEIPLYSFERGNLEFTLPAENYILFERWLGNIIQPNLYALDAYFLLFTISLIVLFSIVSSLPRFWCYAGGGIMALLVSSIQWHSLLLAGLENKIPVISVLILFLGILVYFQAFHTTGSFLLRLVTFTFAFTIVGVIVNFASGVTQPLRHLAVSTLPAALVLLILFIILVSHQLIASFITLATASSRAHGLRHYLIISGIYLLNLWLAYWARIGWIDWQFTIPGFVLLTISAVLTVWTIRDRQPIYEGILKSEALLVYFILAFGIQAFATMGYLFASSNDIALLSVNDIILYAHIGYGMVFVMYSASNFLGMFEKKLPIQKVLYKPVYMPYFSYRFAGFIFTLAFILYKSWLGPVNHFMSGYYTALGDVHFYEPSAKAFNYYRRANFYSSYNQHAATALATLEQANGNFRKEKKYSVDANGFRPTEFTLLNTDYLYFRSGNVVDGMEVLQEGKQSLPSSGVIKNSLGLAYTRMGMHDSARYYFTSALADPRTKITGEINLLGLSAKNTLQENADSAYQHAREYSPSARSNAIAMANAQGRVLSLQLELPPDSILDLFSAALVANYLTNRTNQLDTALLSRYIHLARKRENQAFLYNILPAAAKACFAAGQVNKAVLLLQEVIFSGANPGLNNYTLGLWAMDQEKYDVALGYFAYALNHGSASATLASAVALAEEGRTGEAIIAWDTLSHRKNSADSTLGESMKRVLAAPPSWYAYLSEHEKLYYALYRIPLQDSILFNQLISQIKDEDLRAKGYLNRAKKYFFADEIRRALRQYNLLQGLHLTNTRLFADIKYFELRLLAAQRRTEELQASIDQGILFGPYHESERVYYRALQQEAARDSASATLSYAWLTQNNWYFDDGIIAAARYFRKDVRKSYTILSDALQANPHSVKILKAYIPVALSRGFDQFAAGALETLRGIMLPDAFRKFVAENQLDGLLPQ